MSETPTRVVENGWTSAQSVEALLRLTDAKEPILDATYGRGMFWRGSCRRIVGLDVSRPASIRGSFLALPFADAAFPTVVYDPPFHPSRCSSAELGRFGSLGSTSFQARPLFIAGLRECWRVAETVLLVKCQHFINENRVQWMPLWAIEELGYPYDWLVVARLSKLVSSAWKSPQLSLYRNHADYLVWKKTGHVRRRILQRGA